MSKKGVSAEEKKSRMMQLFYERGECFQLKELEKIAPKEKGIVAKSVKDVVQKLVEDGLVDTDKIGGSIYFWAFPSKALNSKKRALEELRKKVEESEKKLKVIEQTLDQSREDGGVEEKRIALLEEINDKEIELQSLQIKLRNYQENDADKLKVLAEKAQELKDAANRWTDNIFMLQSWIKRKFVVEERIVNKQLGISDDLDYVE